MNANGTLNYDLAQITPLLKPFVGEGIQLVGRETARFQAAGSLRRRSRAAHWSRTLAGPLRSCRGESANVYGLPIGPGKLAAALGDGLVRVDPLAIAVAEGQLTTAPQVRLDPEPMELTLPPGPVLTNVRISPQVSEAMLKYIAPVLAGATQSEGQFSLQLERSAGAARRPEEGRHGGAAHGALGPRRARADGQAVGRARAASRSDRQAPRPGGRSASGSR